MPKLEITLSLTPKQLGLVVEALETLLEFREATVEHPDTTLERTEARADVVQLKSLLQVVK